MNKRIRFFLSAHCGEILIFILGIVNFLHAVAGEKVPLHVSHFANFYHDSNKTQLKYSNLLPPDDSLNVTSCVGDTIIGTTIPPQGSSLIIDTSFWNFGDGTIDTVPGQQPVAHAYSAAGTYTIALYSRYTDGSVSLIDSGTAIVYGNPTVSFSVTQNALCAQNIITFQGTATTTLSSWTWYFGDPPPDSIVFLTSNATHTYSSPGDYSVTLLGIDDNGCFNFSPTEIITVNPLPEPNFTYSSVCVPDSVFLSASNSGSTTVSSWEWEFDNSTTSSGQVPEPTEYITTPGPHNIVLTEITTDGCVDSITQAVTANNPPIAAFNIDSADCSSAPVVLNDLSTSNGTYGPLQKVEITWDSLNNPDTYITVNAPVSDSNVNLYPTTPTNVPNRVSLRAYSTATCFSDTSVTITLLAAPSAQLPPFNAVCQEDSPFVLNTGYELRGLAGNGYYSGPGVLDSTEFSPEVAGAGTHAIEYTFVTSNGCSSDTTQNIVVQPTPTANYGLIHAVLAGDSATLYPISDTESDWHYSWTPSTFLNSDTFAAPQTTPTTDMQYLITVRSSAGCVDSTTLLVKVVTDFDVPNTFTPNGDGINDTWIIQQLQFYPNHRIRVFDRYGQKVFESSNYTPWDGTYNGKALPAGTYYYIIELGGILNPKTGYVTILK